MAANKERVIKPDNLLLENSMSIFHLIMPLISEDRGATTAQDLRARLEQAFSDFERRCYENQIDTGSVSEVKYAIAAFVDEKVMGSAWPHKLSWMGKPLQLEYFGDNLAGEGFFQKLTKLRQSGDRNIDAIEVYYLCMQLGFEGMYRMRGMEQLQALQVDLRTQIADSRNRVPRTLSPHGIATGSFINKIQREVPYWLIAVATLFIIFISYLLFAILLGYKADTVSEILQNDGQRIQANLDRDASQKVQSKIILPVEETPPKIVPVTPPRRQEEKTKVKKVKPVEAPKVAPAQPKLEPKPEVKPEPKKVIIPITGF